MSVRVVAPCRLHFGLFHVPVDGLTHDRDGRPIRKFGGLGLMIDNPCVTVVTGRTHHDKAVGSLAERTRTFLDLVRFTGYPGWRIDSNGPPEHVGLGVGTALGMSLAAARFSTEWQQDSSEDAVWRLATRVERGRRSAIGVMGFREGGLILDEGKEPDETLPRLGMRFYFPEWWRVVLVRPPSPPEWFGDRERTAFARTRPADKALSLTDRLRTLAYDTVVPAVRDADFDTFALSISDFNRLAGEPFHDDQGGPYAGAEVACVIDELMEMGAVGVGQSSWGPTVFAMCRDADEAERMASKARARFSSATEVTVTAANNTGARIETV